MATHQRGDDPQTYRTLTTGDALDVRMERLHELEREHYRLVSIAAEPGGATERVAGDRADVEARIRHHIEVLWPSESDEVGRGSDEATPTVRTGPRGTALDPSPLDGADPLGDPLACDGDHDAALDDGPVEIGSLTGDDGGSPLTMWNPRSDTDR